MVPINPNCKFQTIQKCLYNSSLPLYGGFKAFLKMLCCKIYSQYWYWYWGIGVLGLYWNWYWYWTFPYLGIGIGIELRPIWSIGIGIDLGPVGGIGIGLAKLVLSVSGLHVISNFCWKMRNLFATLQNYGGWWWGRGGCLLTPSVFVNLVCY